MLINVTPDDFNIITDAFIQLTSGVSNKKDEEAQIQYMNDFQDMIEKFKVLRRTAHLIDELTP